MDFGAYDYIVLLIIAVSVLFGIYKGFISSAGSILVTIAAWGCALVFTDDVALFLQEKTDFMEQIIHYVQANEAITDLTLRKTSIYVLSESEIAAAIDSANLPVFFKEHIALNIQNEVFSAVEALGDYFDYTVGAVVLNIGCFVAILIGTLIAASIAKAALEAMFKLPALKYVDGLLGGTFGVVRGVFFVYIFFMLMPVVLMVIPESILTEFLGDITESSIANVFYENNILLKYIGGFIKL